MLRDRLGGGANDPVPDQVDLPVELPLHSQAARGAGSARSRGFRVRFGTGAVIVHRPHLEVVHRAVCQIHHRVLRGVFRAHPAVRDVDPVVSEGFATFPLPVLMLRHRAGAVRPRSPCQRDRLVARPRRQPRRLAGGSGYREGLPVTRVQGRRYGRALKFVVGCAIADLYSPIISTESNDVIYVSVVHPIRGHDCAVLHLEKTFFLMEVANIVWKIGS